MARTTQLCIAHLYCRYACANAASAGTVWYCTTEVLFKASMVAICIGHEIVAAPNVPSGRACAGLHL
jgi:hypothetical protein